MSKTTSSATATAAPSNRSTFTQAIADAFLAQPLTWIGGLRLSQIGGRYGWRARISDVRQRFGMVIECRRSRTTDGIPVSEFRYVPPTPMNLHITKTAHRGA